MGRGRTVSSIGGSEKVDNARCIRGTRGLVEQTHTDERDGIDAVREARRGARHTRYAIGRWCLMEEVAIKQSGKRRRCSVLCDTENSA